MEFSADDFEKMMAIERSVAIVLARAREQHVEAAVVAFACVRCARILLDQYPPTVNAVLCDLIDAFLRHGSLGEKMLES